MKPLVSILLATRNNERTIEAAVSSMLTQTHENFELIIVNDASEDDTLEIVHSFKDARIRTITNGTRLGLAYSLNTAVSKATSDYFARMDADDLSYPTRLERQVTRLCEESQLEVLGTAVDCLCLDGRQVSFFRPEYHAALAAEIHRRNPFFHPTVIMRRRFYERNNGYSIDMHRSQDYDLWLRGFRESRFGNITEPLLRYSVSKARLKNAIYSGMALWRAYVRYKELRFLFATCRPLGAWFKQTFIN